MYRLLVRRKTDTYVHTTDSGVNMPLVGVDLSEISHNGLVSLPK